MEAERAERERRPPARRRDPLRRAAGPRARARGAREPPRSPMVKEEVDEDDVAAVVARWTGIPVDRLLEGETEKLIHMEERLHQRVVGQHEAVEAVANALRRARTGLQDPNRPIGSFVFLGPTGVGQDRARAGARRVHVRRRARDGAARHVGVPGAAHGRAPASARRPGYVGYEEGGQLTEAVRRRPYSVVLLDEIEKAHAEVFDVLLQILDDGRLTDGQGRTVDFRNTVIIMTSNIRSAEQMREHFRPEFLNRIDEIVVFQRAHARPARRHRRAPARAAARAARRARADARAHGRGEGGRSPRRAGTRPTARGRSSARSSGWSRTRSRCACSRATSARATRCASTRRTASSSSRSRALRSPQRRSPARTLAVAWRGRDAVSMLWRRKRRATLDDVTEYLSGFGRMLQNIDAKLEEIVELLRNDGED